MKTERTSSAEYDMLENTTQNVLMFLGKPEGGKTSLLRSARDNEPTEILERTVILERGKLNLGYNEDERRNVTISTYDFGAQDIYEAEYPIFLRGQNIIALIVIPFDEYRPENHDELVTRWLQNCVLAADCKVLFVISKSDYSRSAETLDIMKREIKQGVLKYIDGEILFLTQEREALRKESPMKGQFDLSRIDLSLKFFERLGSDVKVMSTSIYNTSDLLALKETVQQYVDYSRSDHLPDIFHKVINFIQKEGEKRGYYMTLDEVIKHFKRDYKQKTPLPTRAFKEFKQRINLEEPTDYTKQVETCLEYYHTKGWILWYSGCKRYIYVNVNNILKLHRKLYRHNMDEFLTYDSNMGQFMDETEFKEQKNLLLGSGVMSSKMLTYLWAEFGLDPEEQDSMIKLLLVNDHCFVGQGTEDAPKSLMFPWFIEKKSIETNFSVSDWPEEIPYDNIEFHLNYGFRRIPSTVYERISVGLHQVTKPNSHRRDWKHGLFIQTGQMKLLIQRKIDVESPNLQELSIKFRAPSKDITLLWEWCLDIYGNVINRVIGKAKIIPYKRKAFVCPHCILSGVPFEESERLLLDVVMTSRCGHHTETTCGGSVIAAAFVAPLLRGKSMYS